MHLSFKASRFGTSVEFSCLTIHNKQLIDYFIKHDRHLPPLTAIGYQYDFTPTYHHHKN